MGCSVLLVGGLDDTNGGPYSDRHPPRVGTEGQQLPHGGGAIPKVTVARGHVHQTPVYHNHLYSVGGRDNDSKQIGVIDIGTIEHP